MNDMTKKYYQLAPDLTICRIVNGMWQVAGGHGYIDNKLAIEDMIQYHDAGFTRNNKVALVACLENIGTTLADGRVVEIGVIATNIFERNEQSNQWLLIHHHGSHITNYIPPNISSQE